MAEYIIDEGDGELKYSKKEPAYLMGVTDRPYPSEIYIKFGSNDWCLAVNSKLFDSNNRWTGQYCYHAEDMSEDQVPEHIRMFLLLAGEA